MLSTCRNFRQCLCVFGRTSGENGREHFALTLLGNRQFARQNVTVKESVLAQCFALLASHSDSRNVSCASQHQLLFTVLRTVVLPLSNIVEQMATEQLKMNMTQIEPTIRSRLFPTDFCSSPSQDSPGGPRPPVRAPATHRDRHLCPSGQMCDLTDLSSTDHACTCVGGCHRDRGLLMVVTSCATHRVGLGSAPRCDAGSQERVHRIGESCGHSLPGRMAARGSSIET